MDRDQNPFHQKVRIEYNELFELVDEIHKFSDKLLDEFNKKNLPLSKLPAHKRIFLFFLTRALKTCAAIDALCKEGYGQDVSTLLRSLLENLISVEYIIKDSHLADQMAVRFVEYKWIIFKRQLPLDKKALNDLSIHQQQRRTMILQKCDEYKKKFNISSDRALITWSGRSVRDMAKMVSEDLLHEYDSTFRLCSRFSHPSIIGDREYLDYKDNHLTFSSAPSIVGIIANFKRASKYIYSFLNLFNKLFNLDFEDSLLELNSKIMKVFQMDKYSTDLSLEKSISGIKKGDSEHIFLKFRRETDN